MIIAIDARALAWAGVGRYVRNLMAGLAQIDQKNEYVVLIGREDEPEYRRHKIMAGASNFTIKLVDSSYYTWREQILFWRQAEGVRADLWHFPNFNIPIMWRKPYVVTVHDITRFIFPGQKEQGLWRQIVYEQVFKRAVEKADGVIFVSQATREEINKLPITVPARAKVVGEGVEERFLADINDQDRQKVKKLLKDRKYLLYVGVWMNHKNLPRLLEAFAMVAGWHQEIDLVLTGQSKPGFVDVKQYSKQLGIDLDRIKFIGQVADEFLPALYAGAQMLVFPSLYEGFGLPSIEAAACGTPVVTSNLTSLPEVMGKAAEYVNPEDTAGIAKAIDRVLTDNERRRELTSAGRQQARKFRWEDCAAETLKFYKQALGKY